MQYKLYRASYTRSVDFFFAQPRVKPNHHSHVSSLRNLFVPLKSLPKVYSTLSVFSSKLPCNPQTYESVIKNILISSHVENDPQIRQSPSQSFAHAVQLLLAPVPGIPSSNTSFLWRHAPVARFIEKEE